MNIKDRSAKTPTESNTPATRATTKISSARLRREYSELAAFLLKSYKKRL